MKSRLDPIVSTRINAEHRQALKVVAALRGVDLSTLILDALAPLVVEGLQVQARQLEYQRQASVPARLQTINV